MLEQVVFGLWNALWHSNQPNYDNAIHFLRQNVIRQSLWAQAETTPLHGATLSGQLAQVEHWQSRQVFRLRSVRTARWLKQ